MTQKRLESSVCDPQLIENTSYCPDVPTSQPLPSVLYEQQLLGIQGSVSKASTQGEQAHRVERRNAASVYRGHCFSLSVRGTQITPISWVSMISPSLVLSYCIRTWFAPSGPTGSMSRPPGFSSFSSWQSERSESAEPRDKRSQPSCEGHDILKNTSLPAPYKQKKKGRFPWFPNYQFPNYYSFITATDEGSQQQLTPRTTTLTSFGTVGAAAPT